MKEPGTVWREACERLMENKSVPMDPVEAFTRGRLIGTIAQSEAVAAHMDAWIKEGGNPEQIAVLKIVREYYTEAAKKLEAVME